MLDGIPFFFPFFASSTMGSSYSVDTCAQLNSSAFSGARRLSSAQSWERRGEAVPSAVRTPLFCPFTVFAGAGRVPVPWRASSAFRASRPPGGLAHSLPRGGMPRGGWGLNRNSPCGTKSRVRQASHRQVIMGCSVCVRQAQGAAEQQYGEPQARFAQFSRCLQPSSRPVALPKRRPR